MNILYVSALEGGKYTGPIYSVPNQILQQKKYDNVYWVNLTAIDNAKLFDENLYHYAAFKKFRIKELPTPFSKPDLIVFEEFFKVECCVVARQAEKLKIPYIIIPRCQMTENYLKNKRVKKMIASKVLFNQFARKSAGVQFLTAQEQIDSKQFYSGKSLIIPNGIEIPNRRAEVDKNPVVGTFIGRYSIWQKGLDLLIEAIENKKDLMKKYNITFQLFGPNDRTSLPDTVKEIVRKKGIDDIVSINGPVFDDDKRDVLLGSSFFIHTSRFEGMPMSVLEALSYGLPCLVTHGSNMKEDVERYDAGWGADNTVKSIENALQALCGSLEKLNNKSLNALRLAEIYSWDFISEKTHNDYIELLHSI